MSKTKVGDIFKTKKCGLVKVVEYNNSKDIVVEFVDEHRFRKTVCISHLRSGEVKNPFSPSVFGVGFIGVGSWKRYEKNKKTPAYMSWTCMLQRAYSSEYHERYPTYTNVTVCREWHNFQKFAEWFYNQPNAGRRGYALDKDLIDIHKKEYSAETCSFVPREVNNLLIGNERAKGQLPTGVAVNGNGYTPRLRVDGERVWLGSYPTAEEASRVYKREKMKNVKRTAEVFKDDLHPTVYENLINWGLEELGDVL